MWRPTKALDLDGIDAAHKAVILAYLAHGKWVKLDEIICEGIRQITGEDIEIAGQLGYKIKLLAVIARDFEANKLSVRLHPALISKKEVIAGSGRGLQWRQRDGRCRGHDSSYRAWCWSGCDFQLSDQRYR
jgi:homoserine dehydrogenase